MKRFAMEQLQSWKEKEKRKPMIIMGARQVGKTWLMKEFGRQFFPKVAYVSFYNNKRMSDVFEMDFDIQRFPSLPTDKFHLQTRWFLSYLRLNETRTCHH